MAIKSQADQRRTQAMKDQHGRPWSAQIEKASGFPTGLVQPMFTVPHPALMPEQKYLLFDPGNATRVTIDYPQWIEDLRQAQLNHDNERIRARVFTTNPIEVAVLIGPPPMSRKPVVAMQQGNAWALGLSAEKPPEAEEFFPSEVTAADESVFSGPVFTQPVDVGAAPTNVADILAEMEARCPPELTPLQRHNWLLAELKRLKQQPVGV